MVGGVYVNVEAVSITDSKFSDTFTQAIEAKVTASRTGHRRCHSTMFQVYISAEELRIILNNGRCAEVRF